MLNKFQVVFEVPGVYRQLLVEHVVIAGEGSEDSRNSRKKRRVHADPVGYLCEEPTNDVISVWLPRESGEEAN